MSVVGPERTSAWGETEDDITGFVELFAPQMGGKTRNDENVV
jgi:hypothetical protein